MRSRWPWFTWWHCPRSGASGFDRRSHGNTGDEPLVGRGGRNMSRSIAGRALHAVFSRVNRKRQWHELPFPISDLNLLSLRLDLRELNLYDTEVPIRTHG